jgi:hypothetical protein
MWSENKTPLNFSCESNSGAGTEKRPLMRMIFARFTKCVKEKNGENEFPSLVGEQQINSGWKNRAVFHNLLEMADCSG